jgi:hypothetical protein
MAADWKGNSSSSGESQQMTIRTFESMQNSTWGKVPGRAYLKTLELSHFPSDFVNDTTPHCLESPKLVASLMT